ncbi:MAG TPA: hypothetical protein VNK96_08130 [Fimbriimonadales bacterium]|nr:hypothetical protein [Fimbriimonadales bacterium]
MNISSVIVVFVVIVTMCALNFSKPEEALQRVGTRPGDIGKAQNPDEVAAARRHELASLAAG